MTITITAKQKSLPLYYHEIPTKMTKPAFTQNFQRQHFLFQRLGEISCTFVPGFRMTFF